MRLASDYKHKHRCRACTVVRDCYDHDCINAGGAPPPEGYLETCDDCDREHIDFKRWWERRKEHP